MDNCSELVTFGCQPLPAILSDLRFEGPEAADDPVAAEVGKVVRLLPLFQLARTETEGLQEECLKAGMFLPGRHHST